MFKAKLNLNTRYYICMRIIKFECLPYYRNILIFLSFTLILGCNNDDVIEIRDNHKSTENCISLVSEFLSTFDIIKDVFTSENIFNPDRLTVLPIGAELVYLDTTFFDGDGMDVLIRFGDLGTSPHGLLCKDNKYRSGAILLSLDQDYLLDNSTLKILLSPDEPFYSGDGDHMTKLIGGIKFQSIGNNRINIKCNDFKFINSASLPIKNSLSLIQDHIYEGALAFLKAEYRLLAYFVVGASIILAGIAFFVPTTDYLIIPAFIIGAVFSALAGNMGMKNAIPARIILAPTTK